MKRYLNLRKSSDNKLILKTSTALIIKLISGILDFNYNYWYRIYFSGFREEMDFFKRGTVPA